MKTYFRILNYAPNLVPRMVQFLFYSVLGIVFGVINLTLAIPLLDMLFKNGVTQEPPAAPVMPEFTVSMDYLTGMFEYYVMTIVNEEGVLGALKFICIAIVLSMLVASVFRYMERMVASRLKVDVVKNIRMNFFQQVSRLHIGYFNEQRKGDLIS